MASNNGRQSGGNRRPGKNKGQPSWAEKEGRKIRRKEKKRGGASGGFGDSGGKMSLDEIMSLTQKEPDEIAVVLERELKRFQQSLQESNTLKESEKIRYIEAIIEIMSKVSQVSPECKDSSNTVMAEFLSDRCSVFHLMLNEYVQMTDQEDSLIIRKLCNFCQIVAHSLRDQSKALPISELKNLSLPQDLAEQMESLVEMQREFGRLQKQKQASHQEVANHDPSVFDNWDNSQYRNMPILPTIEEVVGSPPPLRSNIINGCYTGWEHYYDVQFRLLREDFIAPLRKGISEYCSPNRTARLSDVYIYNNVRIQKPVCTQEGLCYNIKIDLRGLNLRRGLAQTKRLMFGSLLCFSADNFKNVIYFCIVTNRDIREVSRGVVQVKFEEPLEMLQHVQKTNFVVAESKAFFEASRHVLRSLQNAEVDTMPFTRHLICNQPSDSDLLDSRTPSYPKYLDPTNARYNLKAVYKSDCAYRERVNISVNANWPKSTDSDVELDQSQLDAIKMALTQEIALIQGPPGTGKTYIGYKIVQTLLENRQVWDPHTTSPILVMCFTNHALDQFLEGIIHHKIRTSDGFFEHKRSPKIVRIGGRSKSEEIQQFTLRNVRRQLVPRNEYRKVQDMKFNCLEFGSRIAGKSTTLQKIVQFDPDLVSTDGMLRLKQYMHPSHFYQIAQLADIDEQLPYTLEMWLGLWERKLVIQEEKNDHKEEDLQKNEASVLQSPLEIESEDEEDLIAIQGEVEMEEEVRRLDDDDYSPLQAKEVTTDDELTHFIKSKSKVKIENNQLQNTFVWERKTSKQIERVFNEIKQAEPMEEYSDEIIPDITSDSFTMQHRYQLLMLWMQKYERDLKTSSESDIATFDKMCRNWKEADQNLDRIALERAEVIGMTTTGAAKYQHIIHLVKPKIVIVEEAAELLESHIVSALNAGTQHLILIGDHKQLRPKPNEYDLAKKHNLHISLFERLILLNRLPHATLMIQHRMRPQIASLVCPHIYEELVDHDSVKRYGDVKGFRKNMYFLHHEEKEEHNANLLSHANEYEAKFIVSLCRHLLKLGYEHSQITILTAYSGQLLKLMNKMPKNEFDGVKITNVDNFQGEENDIIILSLVRNNDNESVGFLKEENRVCVALSRARVGLFCFGNFNKLLRVKVPIWDRIMTQVEGEGCLGTAFPLQCPNHPDMVFDIQKPDEFAKHAPEGGCGRPCQHQLDCGHSCRRLCHADDPQHKKYDCMSPCSKICDEEEHPCGGYCFETPCPPCNKIVNRVMPNCGHKQSMKCCDSVYDFSCEKQCEKLCPKGHQCLLRCWQGCYDLCQTRVLKKMPGCGHEQRMMCYQEPEDVKCKKRCNKIICKEGHRCTKECWEDCGECETMVKRKLPNCVHSAEMPCRGDPSEYVCTEKCTKQPYKTCEHLCTKTCSEQCDPVCMKQVLKQVPKCGHIERMPCFQMPDNWTCTKPCTKTFQCEHRCKRKCGEDCLPSDCTEPKELKLHCNHTISIECRMFNRMKLNLKIGRKIACPESCGKLLECGHHCKNKCSEPCTVQCPERCRKLLNCGHSCKNMCFEPCTTQCLQVTEKRCPKGTHKMRIACGKTLDPCKKPCPVKMSCGHPCTNQCGEECSELCNEKVKFKCPCGHTHNVKCSDKSCKCKQKCQATLECGHKCSGKCGECFTTRIHAPCPFEVHVKRFCGHYASVPCFGLEDTCNKSCQLAACLHTPTPCEHKCSEPCDTVCAEPCQYKCAHRKCSKPCFQRCDAIPCSKPCDKMLDCGHQCLGICGEKCLTSCVRCDKKSFQSNVKGIDKKSKPEAMSRLQYVELHCGHIFTVAFLDKYYQPQAGKDRLVSPLLCPTCQKITVCGRYMKIMKERKEEMECVKSKLQLNDDSNWSTVRDIITLETEIRAHIKNGIKQSTLIASVNRSIVKIKSVIENGSREIRFALEILVQLSKLCLKLITEQSGLLESSVQLLEHVLSTSVDKRQGRLSLQFISDIKKETYRTCLLYMMEKVQKVLEANPRAAEQSMKDFDTVQKFVDQTEFNNSVLTIDMYSACVHILANVYKRHTIVGLDEPMDVKKISTPLVITKGQWYHCAKGHYYFVPAKYQNKGTPSCELCQKQ